MRRRRTTQAVSTNFEEAEAEICDCSEEAYALRN